MDFGDILKLWDARDRTPPATPENRGKAPSPSARTAQERWLERYGVPEPGLADRDDPPEPRLSRSEIDAMPVDASLDLHGMNAREAEAALASFFYAAESGGCRKVMIVHGKGLHSASEPVLERVVKRWLEKRASAGRSGHADATNGGKGATWVLLKRKGNQRSR